MKLDVVLLCVLFVLKVRPIFIVKVFCAEMQLVLHLEYFIIVTFLVTCDEAVDVNLLMQRVHVFDASVPDGRLIILVKWAAHQRIVSHVLELFV